jgi:hypothetical protein
LIAHQNFLHVILFSNLLFSSFVLTELTCSLLESWVKTEWQSKEVIYLVIDRSQWRAINLLMVSIVYDNRAIPVYFFLLPKKGNSNLIQQKQVLEPALSILQDYKVIVLGDREFCGVSLAKWLSQEQKVYLSLRLKKNEYVELEEQMGRSGTTQFRYRFCLFHDKLQTTWT